MRAKFPNGFEFQISEEQAKKIRFIQQCIRSTQRVEQSTVNNNKQ